MMADEKSDILIRPYQVSDYEKVCQIFSSGIREGFHTFCKQLVFLRNPIQFPIQLLCLGLGYFATKDWIWALLPLAIYCVLAVIMANSANKKWIR